MPRKKEAGGIPPHLKVISTINVGDEISPTDIGNIVPYTQGYASKYIFDLKKLGFVFDTKKNGRNIFSWKLISEPANAEKLRERGRIPSRRNLNSVANELLKEIGL